MSEVARGVLRALSDWPSGRHGRAHRRAAAVVSALACLLALVLPASPGAASTLRSHEWGIKAVHASQAWKYSRGSGVTVAVLDTGVYANQADLAGSVTTGPDFSHSDRSPGSPYWGRHGTAVASLVAGRGQGRSAGLLGAAPATKILSIRVGLESRDPLARTRGAGESATALAQGIKYAARRGAKVIELSQGGRTISYHSDSTLRSAIRYATGRGAVLVAPAGSASTASRPVYPAAYAGVIAVGALDRRLHRARYSSAAGYVDVDAPGSDMPVASGQRGYTTASGTGVASAITAGTAALIEARYPELTPSEVRRAIVGASGHGRARLDARRAIVAAARIKRTATTPTHSPAGPSGRGNHQASSSGKNNETLRDEALGGGALLLAIAMLTFAVVLRRRQRAEREFATATQAPPADGAATGVPGADTEPGGIPRQAHPEELWSEPAWPEVSLHSDAAQAAEAGSLSAEALKADGSAPDDEIAGTGGRPFLGAPTMADTTVEPGDTQAWRYGEQPIPPDPVTPLDEPMASLGEPVASLDEPVEPVARSDDDVVPPAVEPMNEPPGPDSPSAGHPWFSKQPSIAETGGWPQPWSGYADAGGTTGWATATDWGSSARTHGEAKWVAPAADDEQPPGDDAHADERSDNDTDSS